MARRTGLEWSFRTVRGVADRLLRDAVEEMDLMLLGAPQRGLQAAGERADPYKSRQPVAVLHDGTEASVRAMVIARRMAVAGGRALIVLFAGDDPGMLDELHEQSAAAIGGSVHSIKLSSAEPQNLIEMVRAVKAGTLVLGLSAVWLKAETLEQFRERLNCPLVLVK